MCYGKSKIEVHIRQINKRILIWISHGQSSCSIFGLYKEFSALNNTEECSSSNAIKFPLVWLRVLSQENIIKFLGLILFILKTIYKDLVKKFQWKKFEKRTCVFFKK
jgi:hypothetical protein